MGTGCPQLGGATLHHKILQLLKSGVLHTGKRVNKE
jgi:hypothetical protein